MPSQEILKIRDGTPLEVARILFFKIRLSQEILKIRYGTPLEAEEILIYIKNPSKNSVWHFSSNLDVPTNVVQRKRVAHIMFFKIRPSQEILKIRDVTPTENKRVARILFFKIRPSQEILKIRYGTPLEAEEILIYIKNPSKKSVCHFSSNLDVPTNVVQRKRVAHILFFKIRPSREILKIRDGTPMEAEKILTYIKKPSKQIDLALLPSQEILKIRDVARILFFKIRLSQEILKIRYGTPLEAEEILIYIKNPSKNSVWHFSSNLDVPTNVVQRKRVAHIMFFKIRPSQEILKIRDVTPTEKILKIRDGTPLEPSQEILKIRDVARILFFKIRLSQEILKIRYGTPLEAEEILIYIKNPSKNSVWHFSSNLDVPTNVVQRKRVAHIMFFKIRPSQEILKIRDVTPTENKRVARILFFKIRPSQEILKIRYGTPLEAEEILIYIKNPSKKSVCHFSSNLDVPTNVVQRKRVAHILFFKIRPSREILKIRDGTPMEKRVARILFFKIRPSQEILKIRDGTPLEPSQEILKIRDVARILFFKIRLSQEILKIRYGTPLEAEEILIYIKNPSKNSVWHFSSNLDVPTNVVQRKRVAHIMFFKIRPSQEILKIRDVTPTEKSVCHFSSNLDVPTNVVQRKRVAHILFFKIRPSREILKIRDVARILFFKIRPSQEILKIRDGTPLELSQEILKIRYGTPLEAEEILIYIKNPSKNSVWHFSSNLDVPTNVVQRKRVAHIMFFKIRPSQEILKIRDATPTEAISRNSKNSLWYPFGGGRNFDIHKKPSKKSVWHFSSNLDVPTNVVQRKRVAHIMFFKIRPSQEILKIRDGTPMEAEKILTYIKKPSKQIDLAIL
ncbi:hypothetical protein OROGR_032142 [Orobanche gracilis]